MIPDKDGELSVGIVVCEPNTRVLCIGYGWNVTKKTELANNEWLFFTISGIELAKLLNK
jgi:hypothetical protein